MNGYTAFVKQRDRARRGESVIWEASSPFNWALDYFDHVPSDLTALVDVTGGRQIWTYGELSRQSTAFANYLSELGVSSRDRVLVLLPNGADFYVTMLALMKLQCFFVPCAVSLSDVELKVRADVLSPTVVIATSSSAIVYDVASADVSVNKLLLPRASDAEALDGWSTVLRENCTDVDAKSFIPCRGDQPMMGVFTSGTSAQPKLVVHSHVSYPVGHLSSVFWQGIQENERHLNIAHPGWAKHSWSSFFVPFSMQAAVIIPPEGIATPAALLAHLEDQDVTSICAPPSWWRQVARSGIHRPWRLRNATAAGEALDEQTVEFFKTEWQVDLRDGYGQSELTAVIGRSRSDSYSRLLPGYENAVLLEGDQEVEELGELGFRLDQAPVGMMLGYFVNGSLVHPDSKYYRAGDIVRRVVNKVELVGRCNNVFKSYDVKISPEELEQNIMASGLLDDIVVFPGLDEYGESVPMAKCVLRRSGDGECALRQWQEVHISHHQHIKHFAIVDALPKNASGKKVRV